ncbi:cyclin-like protein [Coemansia reversa NRRL 1564]|uniref:B-related factor 1 n=1 Tax=Coemansia reversa (strain ATCC 12441 / NRRL 1564) TaxID=763665 RepID=A0A2G5BE70_COERN|nr:cyclin-like protein [Coemansia reversa NRRL 1564]|eukprot:PIA17007.1 cyclin-like protein [Coemansia reversa NRRL 1564]
MGCSACGGTDIEHDASKGMSYCTACGEVCEENTIVAEVTFGEAASGAAVVQGSFVRAGQTRANMSGPGRFGSGQESREMTLYNSRRRIQRLATALRLSEHYIDTAQRYFQLALNLNFTRGRRSVYVSAACLYIVCRTEKSSQMLIDFSDVLQASVFKLGATFARLVAALNLKLPIVDPSIYISRFAAMLEFGDKTQQVCMDAIRLVQRMDRDWIRTGRRPAGICGACILISARMHNFRRTQREIIRVVKIADTTLRRRLDEFRMTPSGGLTVADFRSLWLEQSADPPAFTNNRMKARKAILTQQLLTRQQEGSEGPLRHIARGASLVPADDNVAADTEPDAQDESALESVIDQAFQEELTTYLSHDSLKFISTELAHADLSPDVSTWTELDDDEINNVILDEEEVRVKTEIWDLENKEFVEERERRRKAQEQDESARKRRRSSRKKVNVVGATPLESAQNMLATRRLSKKINYEVLGKLLDNEEPSPKAAKAHAGMIPSGAPSRMISVVGTPAITSGYASPTGESAADTTQHAGLDQLPAALATVVYEEGQDDIQGSTAVDLAAAADQEDEDEDDDFEEEDHYVDSYNVDADAYDDAEHNDGDYD